MPLLEKDLKTSGEEPTVEEGDGQQFQEFLPAFTWKRVITDWSSL